LGGYITTALTTGRYPKWWHGRKFADPITAWVCNKTAKDCRDINEAVLLGPPGNESERGTGMIPGHLIQKVTPKPGTPAAYEFINVEHVSGLTSYIVTKSYDQGREAFQGRNIPFIWNDEEVPKDVADEEKLRIMTVNPTGNPPGGLILYTYTPINGLTEFTMEFMESAGLSIEALRHGTLSVEEEVGVLD
jgi:phage terminase large subunit-like protein